MVKVKLKKPGKAEVTRLAKLPKAALAAMAVKAAVAITVKHTRAAIAAAILQDREGAKLAALHLKGQARKPPTRTRDTIAEAERRRRYLRPLWERGVNAYRVAGMTIQDKRTGKVIYDKIPVATVYSDYKHFEKQAADEGKALKHKPRITAGLYSTIAEAREAADGAEDGKARAALLKVAVDGYDKLAKVTGIYAENDAGVPLPGDEARPQHVVYSWRDDEPPAPTPKTKAAKKRRSKK